MIHNTRVITLFDSRATHSFISYRCVRDLGIATANLPYKLNVSTPTRTHITASHICLNCKVYFDDVCIPFDFICLPMHDVDIILGMDWLSKNHGLLDCFGRVVAYASR